MTLTLKAPGTKGLKLIYEGLVSNFAFKFKLRHFTVVRGKTLSLELLKILLENAGPVFCTSPRFIEATKVGRCRFTLSNPMSTL
jgi:hypothetical protein